MCTKKTPSFKQQERATLEEILAQAQTHTLSSFPPGLNKSSKQLL
jgi:hypothetical protein